MLLRNQRSIFHLGEEGGDDHRGAEHVKNIDSTRHLGRRRSHERQRRERYADDAVVGLQILVQHRHHARAPHSHIVLKQMVLPTPEARHRRAACSFLWACSLCRRQLSPNKDVYMYRGDQGFCSEECRWQQILMDEVRERQATIKKERRGLSLHHQHGPRSTAAIRGAPRRLLAVA
ncbi:FCS-Like Zinc finger 5-like [Phragmites australis]|uniref:FCS-Like Zinc finger 5-like n=1 Tax=Phragmites australis TaxID=29695 RepID=UPI002D7778B4|nr:FCS-Like Zinc finger 5-like [Phragmites australis]